MTKAANIRDKSASPKRLSLSEIVELLLTRSSERSVITLARNAKGETQIDVQIRTADGSDVQTVEQAETKAREVYDRLRETYPYVATDEADVEMTRNAKGDTQLAVKLKTSPNQPTLGDAREAAFDTFKRLRLRLPNADGSHGTGGIFEDGEVE